jgi:hypothetical protein
MYVCFIHYIYIYTSYIFVPFFQFEIRVDTGRTEEDFETYKHANVALKGS